MRPQRRSSFPIVGVGASAGGIAALEGFFRGLPNEPAFAVVIVTHLNPERVSHLHEIVARFTTMAVNVAEHDVEVAVGSVYVLPADATLGIEKGRLQVSQPVTTSRERKPIDIFLASLAVDRGEYSAAVILSGGDGDGTLGAKAVKERGGLTLAQTADGSGPMHPGMPDSAIAAGFIDLAIPAEKMGAEIEKFASGLAVFDTLPNAPDVPADDGEVDAARRTICEIIRNQVGHDFSGYKPRTFMRRVQRRMQVVQLDTIEGYVERLRQNSKEVNELFRDLLINVTNFFRDADAFDALADLVIPELLKDREADRVVRVWVPGCSTGEEVYSIAMLLRERLDTLDAPARVQVFATDIDERALTVARAGRYPEALLDSVSPERRKRFFIADGGSYVLCKEVRDLCIFSPHSVIRDPPFSRIDLVSCRNLLIYFGAEIQARVIPTFHYSLRAGGYLFLGTSENITQFSDIFASIDSKQRIFRAREDRLGMARLPPHLTSLLRAQAGEPRQRVPAVRGLAFRQSIESRVLDRHAPAHVVADREGEVVFYSQRTGKYLEPAAGIPTRQLFSMARKGLRLDLRAVFRQAVESGRTAARDDIEVEDDEGRVQRLSVAVEPLNEDDGAEPLFLVLFFDQGEPLSRDDALLRGERVAHDSLQRDVELRESRERMQSIVEEYETALEELKSSNEELVSVNEELQSTNEELEASKEELQSLNEELQTVNGELHEKVEALDAANADLQNLFENTQVAMVFLDAAMTIRTFTPAMTRVFNVLPGDRGRPLTDLSSRIELTSLGADVRASIEQGRTIERQISPDNGLAHFLVRVAPYRNVDNRIAGAVVTFVDVTTLTRAEIHQRVLIAELNHRVRNMLAVVVGLAEQTKTTSNEEFRRDFVQRIRAMSRAYELVSRENWTDAALDQLVRIEVAPFPAEKVSVSGPTYRLKPKTALALGMVLHELATNSAKHGALSATPGHVAIDWTVRANGDASRLLLRWQEANVANVPQNVTAGFGLRLIEGQVTHTLGGHLAIDARADGLAFQLDLPAEEAATAGSA